MYIVGPLLGCGMWLLTRKSSQRRNMENAIENLFGWFPDFVVDSLSFLLVNEVSIILYILIAGVFGMCIDEALR